MSEKKSMMAIAIAKSICKEYSTSSYSRVVYLENGQEFQIQLFNPHKFTIGAEIFINDEILSNRLVLKPGERVWLERYLDVKKKFKFSTYEVEANDADVQEAIKGNGKIEVKFYKEVRKKSCLDNKITWQTYDNTNKIDYYKYDPSSLTAKMNDYMHDVTFTASGDLIINDNLCSNHTYCANLYSEPILSGSIDCITTTNYSCDCTGISTSATSISIEPETIETGRIEAGSSSNQEFDTVNIDFEYFPFVTEKIKLLPISQKPFTVNDLQKIYCSECGRKLKTQYKFCPYCGTEIE